MRVKSADIIMPIYTCHLSGPRAYLSRLLAGTFLYLACFGRMPQKSPKSRSNQQCDATRLTANCRSRGSYDRPTTVRLDGEVPNLRIWFFFPLSTRTPGDPPPLLLSPVEPPFCRPPPPCNYSVILDRPATLQLSQPTAALSLRSYR